MHLHNRVHRGFCQMHALTKFRLRSPQLLCAKSKLQKYKFQIEEIQITIYITRCIVASARCRHFQSSFSVQMVPSNPSEYKLQINYELQLNYELQINHEFKLEARALPLLQRVNSQCKNTSPKCIDKYLYPFCALYKIQCRIPCARKCMESTYPFQISVQNTIKLFWKVLAWCAENSIEIAPSGCH